MFGRLRPSPALVVACAALVIVLGGTAFGGTRRHTPRSINGSRIRNHSIAGKKLKNDTLTGTQINESTLGTVPSAQHAATADSATTATTAQSASTAGNANAVDGVTFARIFYAPAAATTTSTQLASLGGLTISATCPTGNVVPMAATAVDHAHMTVDLFNAGGSNLGQADGIRVSDFNVGHPVNLTDDSSWGEATFTYARPDGTVVNGQLTFESSNNVTANIFNHSAACLVSGLLTSAGGS